MKRRRREGNGDRRRCEVQRRGSGERCQGRDRHPNTKASLLDSPLRAQSPMASASLRRLAKDRVTLEDVTVYFSRTEWRLLDETQKRLYLHVMLQNFALISSLGCCCGKKDVEAPVEHSISVRVSQAKNSKAASSSQKSHPCESCAVVLRDIFLLVDQKGTQHGLTLLKCGACAKQFCFSANYYQHQEQHKREKPFMCRVDRVSLVNSSNSHKSKIFIAGEAGKNFLTISENLQQNATQIRERPNKIPVSGVTFQRRKNHYTWRSCKTTTGHKHTLGQDKGVVHNGRQCFLCHECGKYFTSSYGLHCHERLHKGERPYECRECGKSFTTASSLGKHQRVHPGERPYECSECGKSFTSSFGLQCHQRVHTRERRYKCNECDRSFTSSSKLCYHERVHTAERPYVCHECGKSFFFRSRLRFHERVHTRERPYECHECGKSYTWSSNLYAHKRVHTGERPYVCSQCGKSFQRNSDLRLHQIVHTGERPYECSKCGKSFTSNNGLRYHQRFHTGERPYECSECGKFLVSNNGLRYHQRVHKGERPYECSKCGRSFTSSSDLRCHQRVHTRKKPYACSHCGKSFVRVGNLHYHERLHTVEGAYECPK
ncbi:zinc finger protein 211-like isoform X1 [Artibeus jamaicensis]|uniref:zinc finger protein 211-like isoform X1 n=1 Tax=Artibeus jamaicensis TaxID=9417 RepID=UPI00235AE343|nr:zinc finger protein 211-like isoform X1 [Artibeus jamaicensis]